jgi:alpha-tubulin suppressor-like RCC1 family protein
MNKRKKIASLFFGSCLFTKLNNDKPLIYCYNDLNEKMKENILKKETDIFIWGNGYVNNTSTYSNFHPQRIKRFIIYDNIKNYLQKNNNNNNLSKEDNENINKINLSNLAQFYYRDQLQKFKENFNKDNILIEKENENNIEKENKYNFIDLAFNEQLCSGIDKDFSLYIWREPKLNAEKDENIDNHIRIGITKLAEGHKVIEAKLTKDKIFFIDDLGNAYFYKLNIFQPQSNDFFETSLPEQIINLEKSKKIHIKELKDIKMLAAGKDHILFLSKYGEVFGMGDDSFGQLGLETFTEERESHMKMYNNFVERRERLPKKVEFPEKISKIVCGENHSLALAESGNVYGFGFNRFLQLSNDEIYRLKIIGLNKPTLISKDKFGNMKVLDIAASRNCSFFMVKDSTGAYRFYSSGEGLRGQLGQNVIKHMSDVEEMPDISGLVNSDTMKPFEPLKFTCGSNHCLLLFRNPRIVYVWGNNEYGELGTKDRVYYESPIPILEEYSLPFKIMNISAGYQSSSFICEKYDSLKKKEILKKDNDMIEEEMNKIKQKKKKKSKRKKGNNDTDTNNNEEDFDKDIMPKSFLRNTIDGIYKEIRKYI